MCRNRYRIWKKNDTKNDWIVLTEEQHKYKKLLCKSKRDTIRYKVNECIKDVKKLYALVAELIGTQTENPLPP